MKRLIAGIALLLGVAVCSHAQTVRWTEKTANDWYAQQPWLVGSNYIPSYAINELEMWQADSFDGDRMILRPPPRQTEAGEEYRELTWERIAPE